MIFLVFKSSTRYFKLFMPLEEIQVLTSVLQDIKAKMVEIKALPGKPDFAKGVFMFMNVIIS